MKNITLLIISITFLLVLSLSAYAQFHPKPEMMPEGATGPGGCKGYECDIYCSKPENMEECMEFAEEMGFAKVPEFQPPFIGPGFGGPPPWVEPEEFMGMMPGKFMHEGMMGMAPPPMFPPDVPPEEMLFGIIAGEIFPEIEYVMEDLMPLCEKEEELAAWFLEKMYEMKEERFPEGDPCAELEEEIEMMKTEEFCWFGPPEEMISCPPEEDEVIEMCKKDFLEHQRMFAEDPEAMCEEEWEYNQKYITEGCREMDCERQYDDCKAREIPPEEECPVVEPPAPDFCPYGTIVSDYDDRGCLIGYRCEEEMCPEVITPAKDPVTGECKEFPTPCDVPSGWEIVTTCEEIIPVCGDNVCEVTEEETGSYPCIQDCGVDCDQDGVKESWECVVEECVTGETKLYTCPDGSTVPWCDCVDGQWVCIMSPEATCPECTITCGICEELDVVNCVCNPITPCCGNGVCEADETYETCPADCPAPEETNITTQETLPITGAVVSGLKRVTGYTVFFGSCEDLYERCKQDRETCESKANFIESCKKDILRDVGRSGERAEIECEREAKYIMKDMEWGCKEMEKGMEMCKHQTEKHLEDMEQMLEKCEEMTSDEVMEKVSHKLAKEFCFKATYGPMMPEFTPAEVVPIVISVREDVSEQEEKILKLIVEEVYDFIEISGLKIFKAKIRADKVEGVRELDFVDDVKLDSSARVKEVREREKPRIKPEVGVVGMLEVLKEKLGGSYAPILSYEEEKIIDASETIKEIEEKDIGYMIRWFLGMVSENEKKEAVELQGEVEKLNSTIEMLNQLATQLKDPDALTLLQEQISTLEDRVDDLNQFAEKKEKRASGILAWLADIFT